MRRWCVSLIALTIAVSTWSWTAFADNPTVVHTAHGLAAVPIDAEKAAQTGKFNILPGLVANNDPHAMELGFDSASEVGDGRTLTFPTPFAVYFVSRSALRHYTDSTKPESLLGRITRFLYPIEVVKDSSLIQPPKVEKDFHVIRSSLTVTQYPPSQHWQVSSVGSSMLIKRFTQYGAGNRNFVVWIPSLSRYYLGSISDNQFMIKAIADDQVGLTAPLTLTAGQETPAAIVFAKLGEEANMQDKGAR
jgi:hypothetical protein